MIYGRLGSTSRWPWGFVVAVLGLSLAQCAHASVWPTQAEASAQCQLVLNDVVSNPSLNVLDSECRYEPVPSIDNRYGQPIPETFGLYRCQVRTRSGGFTRVNMCGASGSLGAGRCSSPDPDGCPLSETAYATVIQPTYLDSVAYFLWREEEEDLCADLESFDTSLMGPAGGANGVRTVCYQQCVWDVFGGYYAGTYPAGYVYFTFEPLGYECSGEPEPGDPTEGDDDPLDLDPEDGGVDPGPDPGDGDPSSSGGATCDSPPQCTGDSLQCNILFQTWSTRCAAEAGGLGEGLDEVVDGLDRIGDGVDGVNDSIGALGNQLSNRSNEIFGQGEDVSGSIPGLSALYSGDKVFDSDTLDQSGFGMPRSCPAILTDSISFGFFGNQYDINFDMMCSLLELVGQILVVLSAFVGVRILLRSVQ